VSRDAVVAAGAAKRYPTETGVVDALPPVDAAFGAGRVTAIVGVSGSGKSTLLRLLATHELPSSGRIEIAGSSTAALGSSELRRLRHGVVAYVAQRAADNLFPQLTLAEHGVTDGNLALVGLAGRTGARPFELSGGELARAAFAAALARGAQVLVVDEPTAELDRTTAASVLGALRAAADAGTTVILATHDPDAIAAADDVLELTRHLTHPTAVSLPPPGDDLVLAARGLRKHYGGTAAVSDASLELRSGELAVIVGRSGSGKSTLLLMLAGWEHPDAGTVTGGGPWHELAFVPQRFGLVPELDVRDNVNLPARLEGGEGRGNELLEGLGLAQVAARYPHQISIGQQQRVAVARALAARPRAVLLDEPTSHQDGASAELVWSAIAAAAAEGTGCLVATHEPDAARRAHTAWSMVDGVLGPLA
jgi:putative ABC transport system ATP-binding protein